MTACYCVIDLNTVSPSQLSNKITETSRNLKYYYCLHFVSLFLSKGDMESEELELVYPARQKMATLSSCFAQLTHKAQTVFQNSAKVEVSHMVIPWLRYCFIYNRCLSQGAMLVVHRSLVCQIIYCA